MAIERYQITCEGSCAGRSVAIDCPIIAPIDISHIYIYIYVYYITLQYITHFLIYDIYDVYA